MKKIIFYSKKLFLLYFIYREALRFLIVLLFYGSRREETERERVLPQHVAEGAALGLDMLENAAENSSDLASLGCLVNNLLDCGELQLDQLRYPQHAALNSVCAVHWMQQSCQMAKEGQEQRFRDHSYTGGNGLCFCNRVEHLLERLQVIQ